MSDADSLKDQRASGRGPSETKSSEQATPEAAAAERAAAERAAPEPESQASDPVEAARQAGAHAPESQASDPVEAARQAGAHAPGPPFRDPARVVRSRHRDRDFALRRALLLADLLGLWLALAAAMVIAGSRQTALGDSLWMLVTFPCWAFLFWAYRLYGRPIKRFEPVQVDDFATLFHALVVGTLGLWLFYKELAPVPQLSFEEVVIFGLLVLPLIALLRTVLRVANLRRQGPERLFAIAPCEDIVLLHRKLENHPEYEMELVGAVSGDACRELGLPLAAEVEDVDALLASGQIDHLVVRLDARYLQPELVDDLVRACHRDGVRFSCFPAARGVLLPGTELNHIEGMGLLSCNPPVLARTARTMKRCLDIFMSALLLFLLVPLMALIALAIKLDSRASVLYRQTRVGRDGRRFQLLKFRTMVPDADRLDAELMRLSRDPNWLVMDQDPRVTRVGHLLRRTSADELPQLWNVLRGDMSMVGPRPLSERDDRNVRGWQRHRLDLMPGITGYWQVLGRNNIPFEEMLEVDYAYVASWSLWYDLKILARTVPAVLRRRGAN